MVPLFFLLMAKKGEKMKEKWYLQTKKADFNNIAEKYNISPIVSRIIRNRDIVDDSDINNYLNGTIAVSYTHLDVYKRQEQLIQHGLKQLFLA